MPLQCRHGHKLPAPAHLEDGSAKRWCNGGCKQAIKPSDLCHSCRQDGCDFDVCLKPKCLSRCRQNTPAQVAPFLILIGMVLLGAGAARGWFPEPAFQEPEPAVEEPKANNATMNATSNISWGHYFVAAASVPASMTVYPFAPTVYSVVRTKFLNVASYVAFYAAAAALPPADGEIDDSWPNWLRVAAHTVSGLQE